MSLGGGGKRTGPGDKRGIGSARRGAQRLSPPLLSILCFSVKNIIADILLFMLPSSRMSHRGLVTEFT